MADNEEITGPVSQADIEAGEKLKNEANELFKSKFFPSNCLITRYNRNLYCTLQMLVHSNIDRGYK